MTYFKIQAAPSLFEPATRMHIHVLKIGFELCPAAKQVPFGRIEHACSCKMLYGLRGRAANASRASLRFAQGQNHGGNTTKDVELRHLGQHKSTKQPKWATHNGSDRAIRRDRTPSPGISKETMVSPAKPSELSPPRFSVKKRVYK